ncbi:hypothetical protein AOL_s00215g505 [Orbilia oligospora ATCC 24927]|uniref:Uncharacterized protein n=1 Tax=Arthrobotrys oligospora (strain ATCC 24927 / CBS 115.81 / DSM 1491) TaxID=756982 RepID=G1XT07_ARTOA|nr:hypothetical protein AOL_s00215g505 [Orbilia oligospora ATCC 24927]EGX43769.1 hypothetical protein AOL_s00215g505 [Orbilia oligospora ATCC 24927]
MKTTSIILVDWGKQNKPLAPAPGPATQTNPPAAAPPPPPKTAAAPPQSTAKAPAPQPTAKAPAPQPTVKAPAPQPTAKAPAPQPTVKAQAPQPTAKAPPPPPPKPAAAPLQPTAKAPAPQPTAKAPAPQPTAKAPAPQSTAKAPAPPPPKLVAAPLQPTAKAPAAPQPIQAPAPGPSTPSSLQPPPAGVNVQETAPAIPNHSKRQDDPTPSNNDPNQGPVQGDATNTATSSVALGEGAYPTPKGTPAIPESPMKEAVQHWWDAPRSDLEDPSTDDSRSRLEELVSNADSLFVNRKSKASIRNALEYIPLFTSDLLRSASDVALPPQFAVFGKFLGPESADSKSCLIRDESIGRLQKPLSGLVFHYSPYHSNVESEPCEAAHLANMRDNSKNSLAPQVTVLVSPSNIGNMRTAYANIPNVTIREFQLNPSQLNIDTMFDLMSVRENSGLLYMDIVRRVLRDMAIENNATNKPFDYDKFKKLLFQGELVGMQSRPLKQRLTILESFIGPKDSPNLFHATPGTVTILDLTCPFVDSETACVLFGICNQLFTSAPKLSGKIIALDEAHRYMTDNASASVKRFAESIIGNIRLERHLGLRTIVSTQDPFIHPEIMELSSMVIFHRFDIPRWFEEIRKHVGFQTKTQAPEPSQNVWGDEELQKPEADIFGEIKGLDTGEACIYCPKLVIPENSWGVSTLKKFGNGVFKVMIRQKITIDGGASKNVL